MEQLWLLLATILVLGMQGGFLLLALAHARAGDWEGAHESVQREPDRFSAHIHACLHRVEGDRGNAAYRYERAGEPVATGSLDEELAALEARLQTQEARRGSRATSPTGCSTNSA